MGSLFLALVLIVFLGTVAPLSAAAYIDANVGSYCLQAAAGVVLAIIYRVRTHVAAAFGSKRKPPDV